MIERARRSPADPGKVPLNTKLLPGGVGGVSQFGRVVEQDFVLAYMQHRRGQASQIGVEGEAR